ncbi:hypothetical protein BaRGS_00013371, partial [Batillaria attramentaria]
PVKVAEVTAPSTTTNSSQYATTGATDDSETQHTEPSRVEVTAILSGAAGFFLGVFIVTIIACARKGRRSVDLEASVRQEAERPPFPHVAVEAAAVDDDGYLVPVARRRTREDAPMLFPHAPEAVDDDGHMTPVSSREGSTGSEIGESHSLAMPSLGDRANLYERPEHPDYTVPNPVYEPLRHPYQIVRQATITQESQPLPSPGKHRGRRFEVQAPMRHEAVDGTEPHRPGPARQVTLYSEFSWDSTGEYCEVVEGEPAWPAPPPEAQAHFSFQNRIYDNCETGKIPDATSSNSSQDVTSNTTDDSVIQHSEPFYVDIKTIVSGAAGLSVVVIVAIIIACARKNKRRFEVQAATRHEAVADPELQRQGPAGQVILYREFRWDSMEEYPEPVEESSPFPHVTVEAAAVDDDGYLVPVARRKTREDAPMLLPPAPEAADDDHEYMTPVPSREGSTGSDIDENGHLDDRWNLYERPEHPDYTVPNPVYEPLRHLYQTVRQATRTQEKPGIIPDFIEPNTVPGSTHDATSATTDDGGTQHNQPFPVGITAIVASTAGGRRFEVQAPMRHEAVDGSEPHRPGPARQVTLYSEFSWDSTGEYCEVVEEPGKIPDVTEPSTTSNSTQDATSNTTDDSDTLHSEPYYMDIKTIVYGAGGLSVVVIVAIIIACARKNKRSFEVQAPMRHEAVADPEPQRPGPARQVTLYSEFSWDSMEEYPEP